jgi:hypothetical protein
MYTTAADASRYVTFITLLYALRQPKGERESRSPGGRRRGARERRAEENRRERE